MHRGNFIGLLVMTVIFPGVYHYLHKSELEIRDQKVRGVKPREYY